MNMSNNFVGVQYIETMIVIYLVETDIHILKTVVSQTSLSNY